METIKKNLEEKRKKSIAVLKRRLEYGESRQGEPGAAGQSHGGLLRFADSP